MGVQSKDDVEAKRDLSSEANRHTGSGSSPTLQMEEDGVIDEEAGRQLEPGLEVERGARYDLIAAEDPKSSFDKILRHFAILSLLIFTAIWGTLTREGLVALNTYAGMSIKPVIWAQSVGCLVMGWAIANRDSLEIW